jgi:GDP-mannose 6-dehydrogenase
VRISVFGLGYVGCVSAACLSQNGHEVLGLDISPQKVGLISSGRAPVIEPGLDSLVRQAVQSGAMRVTSDSEGVQYVENVCREIGTKLADKNGYHVVVIRSTVLPGMTEDRLIPILEECSSKSAGSDFGVCMNPEFLRESNAVADFFDNISKTQPEARALQPIPAAACSRRYCPWPIAQTI